MARLNEPIIILNDITVKIDGGGTAFSLRSRDYKGGQVVVTYQDTAGTLSPGGHPGSYNGQDAYNDMLVTDGILDTKDRDLQTIRTESHAVSEGLQERNRSDRSRGG